MNNKFSVKGIEDVVAQTLFIPLYMKAKQSLEKNSFFSDPIACEIITKLDYDFSFLDKSVMSFVGCAIRAGYFDKKTAAFISKNKNCVVVNIGCGLDARYQRVNNIVENEVPFYNLDLPEVINLREKLIPPKNNETSIPCSLFETQWMDQLSTQHPTSKFIFVAEGVFMYFDIKEVREVISNITDRFQGCEILFDGTSTWMKNNSNKHDLIKYTGTTFKLALDDPKDLKRWNNKIKTITVLFYMDFKEWKKVGMVKYFMSRFITKFRKSSYLVHCITS